MKKFCELGKPKTIVMAKKETKAPVNPENATPTTPANVGQGEKGTNDRFTRVFVDGKAKPVLKADGTADRVAPQAQAILNTLEAVGEAGVTRKELVELLSKPGVLTTKQPVGRILSYYQKELIASGAIVVVKA